MAKRGRQPLPLPADLAGRLATMTTADLALHYDVGNSVIKRWVRENGLPQPMVRKADPVRTSKGATWQALNTAEKIDVAKTPRKLTGFWAKVNKGTGGCWQWIGKSRSARGYGQFSFGGFNMAAHRASWMINRGVIPADIHVLHSCDNPLCVRPDHLFLGTNQDNYDDRDRKGRVAHGDRHTRSKLTAALVLEIRASREPDAVWAKRLGVHASTITSARDGTHWKRVPGATRGVNVKRKLTPEQVRELRALHQAGEKCTVLGSRFGISQAMAWQVANGNAYRSVE
jgi:hypothetical protein